MWLQFGKRILLKVFHKNPDAAIRFPSDEKIALLCEIVHARHKSLKNIYCTMDGLKYTSNHAMI